jgi:ferredoxin
MKKLILLIFILSTLTTITVEAKTDTSEVITSIETTMFGYDFNTESESARLDRIEKHLYGEKKKGNIQTRLKDIQDDTGFTVVKKQLPKNIDNKITQALKEDSTVEYPMVDKLEEEVFKTTYKNENIYKRLDRLETQIFKQTSNESLNNRVDKLASVIRPKKLVNRQEEQYYTNNDLNNYYRKNKCMNFDYLTVTDNVNTIFVFDEEADIVTKCINCGKCADVCPVKINPLDTKLDSSCIRCGLCNYVCPANINLIVRVKDHG